MDSVIVDRVIVDSVILDSVMVDRVMVDRVMVDSVMVDSVIVESVSYVPSGVISLNTCFLISTCSLNYKTGHPNFGDVLEMVQIALSTYFTFILHKLAFLVALFYNLSKTKVYF